MEIVPQLFYPLLSAAIVIVVGAVAILLVSRLNSRFTKLTIAVSGIALLAALIVSFVMMTDYYENEIIASGWYPSANVVGMSVSLAVLVVILGVFYFLGDKREENDTRAVVFGAISVAMAFALSYARLFKLPQGGTVTFASLLPLMVYCCMFGTRRGIIVCFIYGTLQAIQDPFIIHPVQFLLDYSVAYSFIGVSGFFVEKRVFKKKQILGFFVGGVLAVLLRYGSHVLSGAYAFADYVGEGYTLWGWTFAYNAFALVDMAISLIAGSFLFASPAFVRQLSRSGRTLAFNAVECEDNEGEKAENTESVVETEKADITATEDAQESMPDNRTDSEDSASDV